MSNTDFQAQINEQDQEQQLQKLFPGRHCGAEDCEKQCAGALKIAQKLNLEPMPFVQKFIADKIAPEYGCSMPADCAAESLEKMRCRFGFVRPETAKIFDDALDSIRYTFRAKSRACKKCHELDGTVVTEKQARNEEYMRKKGFYRQEKDIYLPHFGCKCSWEISVKQSFWKKAQSTAKDIANGIEYATVEVIAPQSIGISFDAIKIGAEVITNITFFATIVRNMIWRYEKETHTDQLSDVLQVNDYYHRGNWKGLIRLFKKYRALLSAEEEKGKKATP